MKVLSYRILLRPEPEGGYTVSVPSLPGCITYGQSVEEARQMAQEAIELYLETLLEDGAEVPSDDQTLEYTLLVSAHA
ncbi:MAG: type II toxin-antitoxin system HicB family antitoxin [Chloroflexi bacterium]|nr:type II toxin-antitoxin system HicB family antitoxin [Chloroflexota bacterium]